MGMLLATVGALSTFYPEAKNIDDPEERYMATIRLIAKMPTLAAFAYRHNLGLPYVYPDNDLSYPGNFLSMMFKMTEVKYEPDPRLAEGARRALHPARRPRAELLDQRGARRRLLRGRPLLGGGRRRRRALRPAARRRQRGGAADARRIGTVENIPDFLEGVKNREERLMGFGHRVYKNYDPRARIIKKHVDEVFEVTGHNPMLDIATELEKRALDDDYFTARKLYPNVDFYSGLIYEALRIPTEMFTVMFAIPRTSGWIAQWLEMMDDREQKIARPRQIYTGERDVDYVPIAERSGPEKIEGPPARRPVRERPGRRGAGAKVAPCPPGS